MKQYIVQAIKYGPRWWVRLRRGDDCVCTWMGPFESRAVARSVKQSFDEPIRLANKLTLKVDE